MTSRAIIGGLSIIFFCNQFITINRLPFEYTNRSQDLLQPISYRKGSYILTIKYFQHVLNKFQSPKIGDLVVVEQPDKSLSFATVQGLPQTYYSDFEQGIYYFVPGGYIVLKEPVSGSVRMDFIANVRGNEHYQLSL